MSNRWPVGVLHSFGAVVMVFLAIPIVVVIPLSFSSGLRMQMPPPGWSFRWYQLLFTNERWLNAASFSVKVALVATIITIILGLAATLALVRAQARGKAIFYFLVMSPLVVPHLVTGVALFFFLDSVSLKATTFVVGVAHVLVCLPPFVMIVAASLQGFDRNLERAAIALGASPFTAFRRITLPLLAPAVLSGAVIAFLMSFDELVISLMIVGTESQTLPVVIWDSLLVELNPIVTAVSTVLIVFTVIALVLSALASRLNANRRKRISVIEPVQPVSNA